jgi:APA family basic amino acid/polyamine antiporter
MIGITALYLAIHLVTQGVLGGDLAGHPTPLAEAAGRAMGPTGRTLLLVGASISMFGYIGGMTLALTSGFERLAILANLATLLLYAACCLAAWQLGRRDVRAVGIPFRVPGGAVVPFLALGAIAYLLSSITLDEWATAGAVLAVSALLYLVTRGARAARTTAGAS